MLQKIVLPLCKLVSVRLDSVRYDSGFVFANFILLLGGNIRFWQFRLIMHWWRGYYCAEEGYYLDNDHEISP